MPPFAGTTLFRIASSNASSLASIVLEWMWNEAQ
jgi:hypothetical protein